MGLHNRCRRTASPITGEIPSSSTLHFAGADKICRMSEDTGFAIPTDQLKFSGPGSVYAMESDIFLFPSLYNILTS